MQLAVEANEAKDKAKAKVFQLVAEIEEATRQQQQWADTAAATKEKIAAIKVRSVTTQFNIWALCDNLLTPFSLPGTG